MTRKPLIAGNWKMNNTISEGVVLTQEISNRFEKEWAEDVDVCICPPFTDIKPAKTVLDTDRCKVAVGGQNVYFQPKGAYTGEISVAMLKECGCSYCIVGHSERRTLFDETNEDVNLKAKALIEGKISPIVCVGESLEVRDDGAYIDYVCRQVEAAFAGIEAADAVTCVVAYEPIWAIGSGRTATPEQAEEVCAAVRATLGRLYGADVAEKMRVLYGGSMNEGNAELLLAQPNIDGGLIGGAALKAASFIAIIEAAVK
ncbi:triose-phosphate isomerase [Parvibacter caecicola]|uniref:triose-phosphate isomerase n=1 Tax=Parvibacter caecicola TaxID=747645 RepID=UPI0023F24A0D|nr:triose-phosphate isomerase [Parvibacter caecicola]